jgi:hypothetical protein
MPVKQHQVLIGLIAVVTAQSTGAAPRSKPDTFQCDMVVRTTTHGVIDRAKLTTKGNLMRLEKRTGAGLKLLFIRNHQGAYQLNMHTNDGAKWPKEWQRDADRLLVTMGPQGDPSVFFKGVDARRTGRKTIDGRLADVWSYSLPTTAGKSQAVRVYMGVKEKRPLRVEAQVPAAPGQMASVVIEYSVYRWGFSLPDSFFNLPPGAKVVDLGNPGKDPIVVPGGPQRPAKPAPAKRASAAAAGSP